MTANAPPVSLANPSRRAVKSPRQQQIEALERIARDGGVPSGEAALIIRRYITSVPVANYNKAKAEIDALIQAEKDKQARMQRQLEKMNRRVNLALMGETLPDAAAEPEAWKQRARHLIAAYCKHRWIKADNIINKSIIPPTLDALESAGQLGDLNALYLTLARTVRRHKNELRRFIANRTEEREEAMTSKAKNPEHQTTSQQLFGTAMAEAVTPPVKAATEWDNFDKPAVTDPLPTPPPDEPPADVKPAYPPYALDAKQAVFAIPKHIQKELGVEEDKIGWHIRQIYGCPIDEYIAKNGPVNTYDMAKHYIDSSKAINAELTKPASVEIASVAQPGASSPTIDSGTPIAPVSKQAPSSPVLENSMNEAAFVVLLNLFAPHGAELKFTIRAMTVDELAERVDALVDKFTKRGYTTARAAPPAAMAQPQGQQFAPPPPAPVAAANAGVATCVMIKVGASFTGTKPQLEFECDGFEHPLRYTKANAAMLAQLLAGVRKMDGAAFTAADLEAGRKFPGMWFVDWKEAMGSDDKMHRNVMSVRPYAAANVA